MDKITINQPLIDQMYSLNTVEDITDFVTKYKKVDGGNKGGQRPGPLVQSQIDLIVETDINEDNIKGYVMKTSNGTVFQTQLRKDLCVQFLTTSLTRDLFKAPIQDYTEVVLLSLVVSSVLFRYLMKMMVCTVTSTVLLIRTRSCRAMSSTQSTSILCYKSNQSTKSI